MTVRALAVLALSVGLARAQPPDTLARPPSPLDSTARADTIRPYRPARSPGTAVLLSFLLPGGGQVYTGNWWKAALIAPAELTLGYLALKEHRIAGDYLSRFAQSRSQSDSLNYVRHRNTRTVLLWWTGAVVAFSMADAYVSAQMYGFDREMRFTLGTVGVERSRVEPWVTQPKSGSPRTDWTLNVRLGVTLRL